MDIPQNILKELEERKLMADSKEQRMGTDPVQAAPYNSYAQKEEQNVLVAEQSGKSAKSRFFGFFRKKNKATLSYATGTQQQGIGINIPVDNYRDGSSQGDFLPEECEVKASGTELFFDYIAKIAIYLAIFLTPLFFMNSSDTLGLSKQLLVSTLALVAVVCWIGKIISSGNISFRRNIVLLPILLVAASAVLSSFFSSSFWVSFLGDTGRFSFSGVGILSYLIIFYVLSQSFNKKDFIMGIWIWLSSVFVASLFGLFQALGWFILPGDTYSDRTFNTIGSPFHLALFALSSIPFLVAFLHGAKNWRVRTIAGVMIAVQILLAVLIDFKSAWISLALSGVIFVLLSFKGQTEFKSKIEAQREYQKRIALPLFFIVFAVATWYVDVPSLGGFQVPMEISPSYKASLDVTTKALSNWPVFGSGLETFPYAYGRFKDVSLNETNYWGINFNDSKAEVLTLIATSGIFGLAVLLFFVFVFSIYAFKRMNSQNLSGEGVASSSAQVGIFASWIFILASKFFYPTSLPLEFLFWLLPALFVVSCSAKGMVAGGESSGSKVWTYFFKAGSFKTLGIFFVMMVLLFGTLVGTYFSVKRFAAERTFIKAFGIENNAENRDDIINKVTGAITLDQYEVRYFRVLTQVLFQKMNDIVAAIQDRPESERTATQEETALLQNYTLLTINSIQKAIALDSNNVNVYADAAESYKSLAPLVQGADDLAIQNYERASEIEPINPYIKTQLGQLYLVKSSLFGEAGSEPDMELVAKARGLFEKALELNPRYANARYFLGLIQDSLGERQAALENFRILRNSNPDNELIVAITRNLENGFSALGYPPKDVSIPPESGAKEEVKGVPAE